MIITLKDGSKREVQEGISVIDLAKEISEGLARVATAGRVDGKVVDLRYNLNKDCNVEILTFDDEDGKKAYWHTTSHIMAQAIKRLYKDVKLAIGPAIDGGFYYDFDTEYRFSEADFEKIEAEMKKIIKEDLPIERFELQRSEPTNLCVMNNSRSFPNFLWSLCFASSNFAKCSSSKLAFGNDIA